MNTLSVNMAHHKGKVFVVGDIHGDRTQLLLQLKTLNFDFQKDMLFCAGDLVDRGNQDYKVLDLLSEPWFFSVKGNHEIMYLKARWDIPEDQLTETQLDSREFHLKYGGEWAEELTCEQHVEYMDAISTLPYVYDLNFGDKRIGIMHGCNPYWNTPNLTWDTILKLIDESVESEQDWCTFNSSALDVMVWSFDQANVIQAGNSSPWYDVMKAHQPTGVDKIYFGHSYWFKKYTTFELGIYKYIDLGHYISRKGFHIEQIK